MAGVYCRTFDHDNLGTIDLSGMITEHPEFGGPTLELTRVFRDFELSEFQNEPVIIAYDRASGHKMRRLYIQMCSAAEHLIELGVVSKWEPHCPTCGSIDGTAYSKRGLDHLEYCGFSNEATGRCMCGAQAKLWRPATLKDTSIDTPPYNGAITNSKKRLRPTSKALQEDDALKLQLERE